MVSPTAPVISSLGFYIKPSEVGPFEAAMRRLLTDARETPGCLWAYAYRAEDIEPAYMVLSGWDSQASMRTWEHSPRHERVVEISEQEWFRQPAVVRRYHNFG